MTFKADSNAIRQFAAALQATYGDVADAKNYVKVHGDFSFHQTGLIGVLSGSHTAFMNELDEMLGRLIAISDRSAQALTDVAREYDATDRQSAARVDATYPAAPRPIARRE